LDLILARLDKIETRLDKVETRIEEVRLEFNTRIVDLSAQMVAVEIKTLDKIGSLYDLSGRTEKRVMFS
jgi:tetrahydromethanopterin S-methyltransferase subunit G